MSSFTHTKINYNIKKTSEVCLRTHYDLCRISGATGYVRTSRNKYQAPKQYFKPEHVFLRPLRKAVHCFSSLAPKVLSNRKTEHPVPGSSATLHSSFDTLSRAQAVGAVALFASVTVAAAKRSKTGRQAFSFAVFPLEAPPPRAVLLTSRVVSVVLCLPVCSQSVVVVCVSPGARQDQDGEEVGEGDHREVLHPPGQRLPRQQEGV